MCLLLVAGDGKVETYQQWRVNSARASHKNLAMTEKLDYESF
jgi:hypothetical protein